MNLSPATRHGVGVLTLVACVFPMLWVGSLVALMAALPSSEGAEASPLLSMGLLGCLGVAAVFGMFSLGLQLFYVVHLLRSEAVPHPLKRLLGMGLLLMPLVVMPVYYWLYLRRAPALY